MKIFTLAFFIFFSFNCFAQCDQPQAIKRGFLNSSAVRLSWSPPAGNAATRYHLYYSMVKPASTSSITSFITIPQGTYYDIMNLDHFARYYFTIRSACGTSATSSWTAIDSFKVWDCPPAVLPYFEDFEISQGGNQGNGPNCIVRWVGTPNTTQWVFNNYQRLAGMSGMGLQYSPSSINAADAYYTGVKHSLQAGKQYKVIFKYTNLYPGYTNKLRVLYQTSPNSPVQTQIVDLPSIQNNVPVSSISFFTVPTTGIYYIAFHIYSAKSQGYFFLDDISLEEVGGSNTLVVTAFSDDNRNGRKDATEPYFPDAYISCIKPRSDTIKTFSRTGINSIPIDTGTYTTTIKVPGLFKTIVPASFTRTYTTYNNVDTISFAVQPKVCNKLSGSVFMDLNVNGVKDPGEPFMRNARIVISKSNLDSFTVNASNGQFSVPVDTGAYTTKVAPVTNFKFLPVSANTNRTTYFNTDSITFAAQPSVITKDLSVTVHPVCPIMRVGRFTRYHIECKNVGTVATGGQLQFVLDRRLTLVSSTFPPTSITGDTLRWTITNLTPFESFAILLGVDVKVPPVANVYDTVTCKLQVSGVAGETNTNNNFMQSAQVVRGPYDPNDKTEIHLGKIQSAEVVSGKHLQYTIRFQNVGNDTAFNVYIMDTLDSKLDWNSLEVLSSSHESQLVMKNGICQWNFPNINLVDSVTNEAKSHGYITFRIKPKSNVSVGNQIHNKASIYFDYNLPIVTNTETTTITSNLLPVKLVSFTARRQDKMNLLEWKTATEINTRHFEVERSADGLEFNKLKEVVAGSRHYTFVDKNPLLNTNYYRLKIVDFNGSIDYSPIRLIDNKVDFTVKLFPNPVRNVLHLEIVSEKDKQLEYSIVTSDGRRVDGGSFKAGIGSTTRRINVASLAKGKYIVTLSSPGKEVKVLMFDKN
jgi:uncharacterized repeat protein (TIGR01451 family)